MAYGGMEEDLILVSTQLVNTLLLVLLSIKQPIPIKALTVMVYNSISATQQQAAEAVTIRALSCMKLTRHGDNMDSGH